MDRESFELSSNRYEARMLLEGLEDLHNGKVKDVSIVMNRMKEHYSC